MWRWPVNGYSHWTEAKRFGAALEVLLLEEDKNTISPRLSETDCPFLIFVDISILRMAKILIIDDEPAMVEVIATLCQQSGHETYPFNNPQRAVDSLAEISPHLVIADLKMDKIGGFDVLECARQTLPDVPVILITAYASVETAVDAMKAGAYDYITKPFKIDELRLTVARALEYRAALQENVYLKKELKNRYRFENIIGTSASMQAIYNLIGKVANTDSTILIQGESGTGKELVARALHFNSRRHPAQFVAVNCSALPENLLESELFGHKKGSFTGAVVDKMGLFEEAEGGTIFLDEINSMALSLQTKLLRVLQERLIRRVGDTKVIPVNVRVVAASNEDLETKMKAGKFREDLFYRLAVIPIDMPALRERLEDVPLLVNHFLSKQVIIYGTPLKKIEAEAMDLLSRYPWPGNVRELENAVERACALCDEDCIRPGDLPPQVQRVTDNSEEGYFPLKFVPGLKLEDFTSNQERAYIQQTLNFHSGSREKTAGSLGISIATLYRKLEPKGRKKPQAA